MMSYIEEMGYGKVLTKHFVRPGLQDEQGDSGLTAEKIHDENIDYMGEADVIIGEFSRASHGVGYERGVIVGPTIWARKGMLPLEYAESLLKPTLILYRERDGYKRPSSMIRGNNGSKYVDGTNLTIRKYGDLGQAKGYIDEFFGSMKERDVLIQLRLNDFPSERS